MVPACLVQVGTLSSRGAACDTAHWAPRAHRHHSRRENDARVRARMRKRGRVECGAASAAAARTQRPRKSEKPVFITSPQKDGTRGMRVLLMLLLLRRRHGRLRVGWLCGAGKQPGFWRAIVAVLAPGTASDDRKKRFVRIRLFSESAIFVLYSRECPSAVLTIHLCFGSPPRALLAHHRSRV